MSKHSATLDSMHTITTSFAVWEIHARFFVAFLIHTTTVLPCLFFIHCYLLKRVDGQGVTPAECFLLGKGTTPKPPIFSCFIQGSALSTFSAAVHNKAGKGRDRTCIEQLTHGIFMCSPHTSEHSLRLRFPPPFPLKGWNPAGSLCENVLSLFQLRFQEPAFIH
jgi:hypothetical protein